MKNIFKPFNKIFSIIYTKNGAGSNTLILCMQSNFVYYLPTFGLVKTFPPVKEHRQISFSFHFLFWGIDICHDNRISNDFGEINKLTIYYEDLVNNKGKTFYPKKK